MDEVMKSLGQILQELDLIKSKLGIYQKTDQSQDSNQIIDLDPDLVNQELIDQDLDPDQYDLNQAERSLKYYFLNKARINNPKQYLAKSLVKFLKPRPDHSPGANLKTYGFTDDELDQYLGLYTEDLRRRVEDVVPDIRTRFQGIENLTFVAHRRVVVAAAKKKGLLK